MRRECIFDRADGLGRNSLLPLAVTLLIWTVAPQQAPRFAAGEPTASNATSSAETRDEFEKAFVAARKEQRRALADAADELKAVKSIKLDGTRSAALQKIVAVLEHANDLTTAQGMVISLNWQCTPQEQQRVSAVLEKLVPPAAELDRIKLDFQQHQAEELRRGWTGWTVDEKKAELSAYYGLRGEMPSWLLEPKSQLTRPPVSRSADRMFDRFVTEAQLRLRNAQTRFQPQRDAFEIAIAEELTVHSIDSPQNRVASGIAQVLQADYGRGFRGLMVLDVGPEDEMPSSMRTTLNQFQAAFFTALDALRVQHGEHLDRLRLKLAPLCTEHLERGEFPECMALDLRLQELESPLRMIQVKARRLEQSAASSGEPAWLCDVQRGGQFLVRFVLDDFQQWVDRDAILLSPVATLEHREPPWEVAPPAHGPGIPVTDESQLQEGDSVYAFRGGRWQSVSVVDVSPFGVIIRWDGFGAERDHLEPRSWLRHSNGD